MTKVIRFTASWCGPCRVYKPVFENVASSTPGVVFDTVDVDAEPQIAQAYNVRSVPTTIVQVGGRTAAFKTGMINEIELRALVASV